MNYYSMGLSQLLSELGTDRSRGLPEKLAQAKLGREGPNTLKMKKRKSLLRRFFEQFNDFMIIILLAAAFLSFFISFLDGEADYIDPILILAIVILNALMGIIQESKAERAIDSLSKLSAPKSTVIRGGKQVSVNSADLVCGDVILFEAGDKITADCRIIEASGLRAEESSLTGESVPVDKLASASVPDGAPLAERYNSLYSGSSVTSGRCKAVVTATGMDTEVGKIADMLGQAEQPQTPLQKRLDSTGKVLGIGAIAICAVIFVLGVIYEADMLESFMLSVSLAVAAVPEGLPAIVTIVLALGVQRMAGKNAIVRKLPAVETLGSATVICSDKTGTLTQNRMKVMELCDAGGKIMSREASERLLRYGALSTNSVLSFESGKAVVTGDPTENAIVDAAIDRGMSKADIDHRYPRRSELPFDSSRKLMSTIHGHPGGGSLVITKGAPDVLLKLCTHCDMDHQVRLMSGELRSKILRENSEMASRALRVIAVAYKKTAVVPEGDSGVIENNLVFLGLVGMIDPPRPEAREAVLLCRRAGIKPVMITGDHGITASAVATELGILRGDLKLITGSELDLMDDDELRRTIEKYAVFARVTPEHKSRVVKAFQANGEVVAMTGDGVNDAPALKNADIGCAMGMTGTDVARDAADMILTDDNFSTIVSAVKEGRAIYQNIVKTVHFLLSCNVGEILTIFVAFLLGHQSPLLPIQLLWINLVTDSLPALALGSEPADSDIMRRKPVSRSGMFSGGRALDIMVQGIMIGLISLLAFETGRRSGGFIVGRTCAFAVLSLSQLVHAFNIRSDESLFKIGFFSNIQMVGAFLAGAAMQISVICVPALSRFFGTVPLTSEQWVAVALFSLIPLAAMELSKLLTRGRERNKISAYQI